MVCLHEIPHCAAPSCPTSAQGPGRLTAQLSSNPHNLDWAEKTARCTPQNTANPHRTKQQNSIYGNTTHPTKGVANLSFLSPGHGCSIAHVQPLRYRAPCLTSARSSCVCARSACSRPWPTSGARPLPPRYVHPPSPSADGQGLQTGARGPSARQVQSRFP